MSNPVLLETEHKPEMSGRASLVTFDHKILRPCRKLLIRIARRCPRHGQHVKLQKASPSSRKQVTKVVASFFLSFHKKKQKKEKMKRLNELRSFSHAASGKKVSHPEAGKKIFPTNLTLSWLGQGKANTQEVSQDHNSRRDSTSTFLL
ncbi:PREDICTED: uncharacterized protein LOC104812653 [Tarenaya hassleriana]|uniref:uncharacterized protein LOC104812653 n=1 Tax=Tarenaya hassleriana TaxID=28532 RepID=UPI00053C5314|nr:PREDICTED: uncharacterized protein LOC104812653 [Tarenaya hassleriana]